MQHVRIARRIENEGLMNSQIESAVDYAVEQGIAVLTVNYPPVNALSAAVRTGIGAGLDRARNDDAVKAVIILGGGTTFIAGADITQFGTPLAKVQPSLFDIQDTLEAFAKPVIAAIHGTALGGGLELALTCHARVAVASAKVGLPEVNLGILPGGGGTQRLPRLTGVEAAIELTTTGRHVPASRALELGIIDAIVTDLRAGAVTFASTAIAEGRRFVPVIAREERVRGIDPDVFAKARQSVGKKARGKIAPLVIIDCIEAACTLSAEEGIAFERQKFAELYASDQRAALMHYFFAEREARKVPGLTAQPRPIQSCAVIGAGTMGGGIAMVFANSGIPVTLVDISAEALDKGMATIRNNYQISVGRGSMTQAAMDRAFGLISTAIDYADFAETDLVVEGHLRPARRGDEAGGDPCDEHFITRHRPDRISHHAARRRHWRAFLFACQYYEIAGKYSWRKKLGRDHRDRDGAGQAAGQECGSGGQLRWLHRQSHVAILYRRSGIPDGTGRQARTDRPRGRKVRHADGADFNARHERNRHRRAGSQRTDQVITTGRTVLADHRTAG
jgi:enoyl-CoA hydratase/carnithine racemase